MKTEPKKLVARGIEEEPGVGNGQIPVAFFGLLAGLLFLGLLYLDRYGGGYHNMVYQPYYSYAGVLAEQPMDPEAQTRAQGKLHYDLACKLCHQDNGLGTPGTFPPLAGSEWVIGSANRLIRIPMHGLAGPITVLGQTWDANMPNAGAPFDDTQMAALLTYIRGAWGNKAGAITAEQVKKVRDAEGDRSAQWTTAELMALPE